MTAGFWWHVRKPWDCGSGAQRGKTSRETHASNTATSVYCRCRNIYRVADNKNCKNCGPRSEMSVKCHRAKIVKAKQKAEKRKGRSSGQSIKEMATFVRETLLIESWGNSQHTLYAMSLLSVVCVSSFHSLKTSVGPTLGIWQQISIVISGFHCIRVSHLNC